MQEAAKLNLKLSDFDISLVQGLATGAPVALASIPLAWVIDHGNRMRLLICSILAICIAGTVWTAFAGGLPSLFIARMLSALGATCAIAVVISLTADICAPDKRRGRADRWSWASGPMPEPPRPSPLAAHFWSGSAPIPSPSSAAWRLGARPIC